MMATAKSKMIICAGKSYRVGGLSAKAGPRFRQKLVSMGVLPGVVLTVLRQAPFGGPLHCRLNATELCLRKKELHLLILDEVEKS
jgi:ferrous iron transport protein A